MNEEIQPATSQVPNIKIESSTKYLVGGVVFILLVVGIYLWYTFVYKKAKADKEKNLIDPNTKEGKAKIYAQKIESAIHYYGDDEALIYSVAMQMKNDGVSFAEVAQAFQAQYNKNMSEYLSSNLNTADYNKFLSIVQQPSTIATTNKPSAAFTADKAASIAGQLFSELNKGIFRANANNIIALLRNAKSKGDWIMIYNAFGTKPVNFTNKDLVNWIRTVFPSGKKDIFKDLNTRLKTQLS